MRDDENSHYVKTRQRGCQVKEPDYASQDLTTLLNGSIGFRARRPSCESLEIGDWDGC